MNHNKISDDKKRVINILSVILFLLFVLLFVVWQYYEISSKFKEPNLDSYMFGFYGKEILRGRILYKEIWDNKGPLLFFLNAIGQKASIGFWGTWIIEILFTLSGVFLLIKLMLKRAGYLLTEILSILFIYLVMSRLEKGNLTEEYGILFYIIGIYLFWKHINHPKTLYLFFIGISAGCSVMLRGSLVSPFMAIGVVILLTGLLSQNIRSSLREIGVIFCGFSVVLLLFSAYFLIHRAFPDFLNAVFYYNLFYSQRMGVTLIEKIGYIFITYPIWTTFILCCLAVIAYDLIRRRGEFQNNENLFMKMVIIGFIIEIILYNLSGGNYLHYTLTLVPYEVLIIFSAIMIIKNRHKFQLKVPFFTPLFFPIFNIILITVCLVKNVDLIKEERKFLLDRSYEDLRNFLGSNDKLIMWGYAPDYHYVLEIESPSKYYNDIQFTVCGYVSKKMVEEFINKIDESKPVIVDTPRSGAYSLDDTKRGVICSNMIPFFDYMGKEYQQVDVLTDGYPIYEAISRDQ